jgi:phage terminase large subunit-like protein
MELSPAEQLAALPHREREVFLMQLTREELNAMRWDWKFWARPKQLEPPGTWSTWLAMAGRGFGKTRLGAEWVRSQVCGSTPLGKGRVGRVALVGTTAADVRDVMVQGPSGILAVSAPDQRPTYLKSQRKLEWPNGAIALTFSAEEPEQLRGPEHDLAWADEAAKWKYPQETWDMLQFGMRIGDNPRQLVTTTPKPIPLVRALLDREGKGVVVTKGSTYDNAANLAAPFLRQMRERYEGTRLGRQELRAEMLDDVPGALWTRTVLDRRTPSNPLGAGLGFEQALPDLSRVVVGVDPSGSSGEDDSADSIGIVVAGIGMDGTYYVIEDATCDLGPAGWARRAVDMYHRHKADIIVGERNFGGAMVEYTIRTIDRQVNYKEVTASRGKVLRAEPIAALYDQGRVRHVGALADLEDQMCNMSRSGYIGTGSPDRLDALVWCITELMSGQEDYDPAMLARLLD